MTATQGSHDSWPGLPRGAPGPHDVPTCVDPLSSSALAVMAFSQTGCQSGPFSGCNSCGGMSSRLSNLSERMFRPFRRVGSSGCCGTEVVGGPAAPIGSAVVTPVVPVVPGGSALPPATEAGPSTTSPSLEPIPDSSTPSAGPGPPPGTGSSGSSGTSRSQAGKANYEARRPRSFLGSSRSQALARTLDTNPVPTARSARGLGVVRRPGPPPGGDPNPLDNLPPLELPRDVTRPDSSPPRGRSLRLARPPALDAGAGPEPRPGRRKSGRVGRRAPRRGDG